MRRVDSEMLQDITSAYEMGASLRQIGELVGISNAAVHKQLKKRGLLRPNQAPHGRSNEERFWERVDKSGECWLWTGAHSRQTGYGGFRMDGHFYTAHRAALILEGVEIDDGMHVDHLCRTPLCVRPDHLEPVSPRENVMRGDTIPAANAVKTHCQNGHPLSGDNLYICPRGWRNCRICRNAAQARMAA